MTDSTTPQRTGWQYLRAPLSRYLQSILLVVLASAISIPIHFVIEPVNLVMIYLAAVMLSAIFLGRGPAILASILSVLMFDFFLVEPRLSLTVDNTEYLLTFFGLLTVGMIISSTAARLRDQLEISRQREAHTAALNSLSQDLTGAFNLEDMLHSVVEHVSQTFDRPVVILLREGEQFFNVAASPGLSLGGVDLVTADAVFHSAVKQLDSYPAGESGFYFLPLTTALGTVGVLGVQSGQDFQGSDGQRSLLQGFANLTALAIERTRLAEQASQAQVLQNIERLQASLLSSISHELRTPLVSITGALSTLSEVDSPSGLSTDALNARQELIETAYSEAQRLNLLVGNLLDMSRLEAGAFRLRLEPCDIQDLVGITLQRFAARRSARQVNIGLEESLPLLNLDVNLMVQVLENLLENAAKYSPESSGIELGCQLQGDELMITVSDRGVGIPAEDLDKVFDKFYRSTRTSRITGLGLGLSICKGIVEAHNGYIWAENRIGGGVTIGIKLPVRHSNYKERK